MNQHGNALSDDGHERSIRHMRAVGSGFRKGGFPILVSCLLLLLFLVYKFVRFRGLHYTYNDLYIFLQSSNSWMDGRPLLYENIWGDDTRIHNNYEMLLWGPIIRWLGAYGAFVVQVGLLLISYTLLIRLLARQMASWAVWTIGAVLLFGPVWFWFNAHPGIGWHPELTYFPLSILFFLALHSQRTGLIVLSALLVVLVKEDGALLAGCIQLAFMGVRYLAQGQRESVFGLLKQKRFWLALAGWGALFMAGMAYLSYKNESAHPEPRLMVALDTIRDGLSNPVFLRKNLILLGQNLLLLLPSFGLLLYGLYRVRWQQTAGLLLIYGVALAALVLSNWVQSATYYDTNTYFELVSLTWPPRFVLTYAFTVCFVLMVWLQFEVAQGTVPRWQPWLVGAMLTAAQLPIVVTTRPDFKPITILRDMRHRFDPLKEPMLPLADVAMIQDIARTIPARSNVFIFDYLIPFYHKHYNISPTKRQWENADLAILPTYDFQNLNALLPQVMKKPYRSIQLQKYTIYVTPAYEPYVRKAIADKAFSQS